MRPILWVVCAVVLAEAALGQLVPTTTWHAETENNTSAPDEFAAQTNGNAAAGNVSKLPIRNLLYPGASTRVYAHLMNWWGSKSHISIGYRSDDPGQVRRQVDDMVSRGIDGVIIDWYGRGSTLVDTSTRLFMREAELHNGEFEFAVMEDVGALHTCARTAGCDVTQQMIDDLNYAAANYFPSPAYARHGGRPLVFFFGVEQYAIDWARVRAGVSGSPLLVQRNGGIFSDSRFDGAYAWNQTRTSDYETYQSLPYLDWFYQQALVTPGKVPVGSAFKGFNDTLASWSPPGGRHIAQLCGATWLDTMARAGLFYSTSRQLPFLQLVTWNDYEEGTSLETGVDNCVAVSGAVTGDRLDWSITGEQQTIAHFELFASTDGLNLARVSQTDSSARSLDLSQLKLADGSYTLYIKAIGQPSMTNKMSGPIGYNVGTPELGLSATPASLTLGRGQSGAIALTLTASRTLPGQVTFTCGDLPAGARCQFAPATLGGVNGSASSTVTISTTGTTAASGTTLWPWLAMPAFAMVLARGRRPRWLATAALLLLMVALPGCGGTVAGVETRDNPAIGGTPQGVYSVRISAASGAASSSLAVTLTVQ